MCLFDNGKPEDFLLFLNTFNITLAASVMLETVAESQYLCTLLYGEMICQFELFNYGILS